MVHISRPVLYLAAACYAAVTSLALAATTEGNATATIAAPVTATANATASEKAGIQWVNGDQCEITFTYWEHDEDATFDINFVHTEGTDRTTERFHDDSWPIQTSNKEQFQGHLNLVQIWPRAEMVCISAIKLECGWWASNGEYAQSRAVTITADAIQESWIRKTGGQRKVVNWNHGPCLFFRSAGWDKGAFRALDVYRGVLGCGDDYMCMAGHLETFGN